MNEMNDKELLELAAKAAGYADIRCFTYGCMDGALLRDFNGELSIPWNPLIDDGAALRLAVKMNLLISCEDRAALPSNKSGDEPDAWADGDEEDCPYEATRRAIVRAAAEIGKGMK
jgi:hypothetical protein